MLSTSFLSSPMASWGDAHAQQSSALTRQIRGSRLCSICSSRRRHLRRYHHFSVSIHCIMPLTALGNHHVLQPVHEPTHECSLHSDAHRPSCRLSSTKTGGNAVGGGGGDGDDGLIMVTMVVSLVAAMMVLAGAVTMAVKVRRWRFS